MIINNPNKERELSGTVGRVALSLKTPGNSLKPAACKKVRMRLAGGLAKKVRDWQIMGANVLQVRY